MLTLLIDLGWKSALIAGLALIAHAAMRRRPAAERAAVLQATLLALLALPLFALLLPAFDLAWLPAQATAPAAAMPVPASAVVIGVQSEATPSFGWNSTVLALYGAGVVALLLRFVIGLWTLRRWTTGARPAIDTRWQEAAANEAALLRRPVRLLVSPYAETPLSWGVSPAWILIGPATHDAPEQAGAVIAHEMAHIRRFDWLSLVVARLVTALFWFNPLSWLVARELAREAELAADAEALRHISRHDYADALLAVAGGRLAHREANGMAFTRTALARRIAVALDGKVVRQARPRVQAVLLLAALATAAPLAAAQLVTAPPLSPAPLPPGPAPVAPEAPAAPLPEPPPSPEAETSTTSRAVGQPPAALGDVGSTVATARPQAIAVRDPRPTPVVLVATSAEQTTRIVGRTGAQVIVGPNGASLIGDTGARVNVGPSGATLVGEASEDSPDAEALRSQVEGRRSAEEGARSAAEGRKGTINDLLRNAADLRANADNLDAIANQPGQLAAVRDGHHKGARGMRASAAGLEAEARRLTGG
jgi:beta-lactamase regulating signal transducer with metallopeptidase domain